MTATELMIGDWVDRNPYCDELTKLVQVTPMMMNFTDSELERIKPIPLTPEILEKNGFVSIDNGCKCVRKWNIGEYTYADMSFDFNVEVDMLNGASSFLHIRVPHIGILGMPLYYVHTLQHALRLCGLDELADNFKV